MDVSKYKLHEGNDILVRLVGDVLRWVVIAEPKCPAMFHVHFQAGIGSRFHTGQ